MPSISLYHASDNVCGCSNSSELYSVEVLIAASDENGNE